MEESSLRRQPGEGSQEEQSGGGSQEAPRDTQKEPQSNQEARRRRPGGSQEAPRSVYVSVTETVPRPEAPARSRAAFKGSEVTTSA